MRHRSRRPGRFIFAARVPLGGACPCSGGRLAGGVESERHVYDGSGSRGAPISATSGNETGAEDPPAAPRWGWKPGRADTRVAEARYEARSLARKDQRLKDTAYYYPAPYWLAKEGDWIKSLLLFFDEVAILLPDYMRGRHRDADPSLAGPLEEQGLLRILEPKDWIDAEVAETLAEIMVELLAGGVFDALPEEGHFAELSQSRIGYGADAELAEFLVDELQQRGLARPSEDGVSIPLHPVVRTTILVILGQLARSAGDRRGMAIHPATNCREAATDLLDALSREYMPSCEGAVRLDLEPVTLDLSTIPLEEVLQLREDHGEAHRAYMRSLRGFLVELGRIHDPVEREVALLERRQEIADLAHDNRRSVVRSMGKSMASWSMGIAGGVWSAATGDVLGATVGALGLGAGLVPGSAETVGVYSYLFSVTSAFGRRAER